LATASLAASAIADMAFFRSIRKLISYLYYGYSGSLSHW
jgi:hypothetical protein